MNPEHIVKHQVMEDKLRIISASEAHHKVTMEIVLE